MTDFSDHVKLLTFVLVPALGLFVASYTLHQEALWQATLGAVGVVVLVVFILARFGGDPGRTN